MFRTRVACVLVLVVACAGATRLSAQTMQKGISWRELQPFEEGILAQLSRRKVPAPMVKETLSKDRKVVEASAEKVIDDFMRAGYSPEDARLGLGWSWYLLRLGKGSVPPGTVLSVAMIQTKASRLGKLIVESRPAGAEIVVDEVVWPKPTDAVGFVDVGQRRVRVQLAGKQPAESLCEIRRNVFEIRGKVDVRLKVAMIFSATLGESKSDAGCKVQPPPEEAARVGASAPQAKATRKTASSTAPKGTEGPDVRKYERPIKSPVAVGAPPAVEFYPFPWPPPTASAFAPIDARLLRRPAFEQTSLADVDQRLRTALDRTGYYERKYLSVPGGFALVTRLEQMNPNGTSKADLRVRWAVEVGPRAFTPFRLENLVRALFRANPGYFRIIVFIVTPEQAPESSATVSRDEATDWMRQGLVALPPTVGAKEYTDQYSCTAYVYEFQKLTPEEPARSLVPGRLPGRIHLEKAGIWQALEG